jgi:hypothetical protein
VRILAGVGGPSASARKKAFEYGSLEGLSASSPSSPSSPSPPFGLMAIRGEAPRKNPGKQRGWDGGQIEAIAFTTEP